MKAELVIDCRNQHGEGVLWNPVDGRIWWTDIEGRRLWWYEPGKNRSGSITMADRLCCFAPRRSGGFICAFAKRIALMKGDGHIIETIAEFEPENPNLRLNDGRTDRQGRLVVGGMNEKNGAADGSVLCVDTSGRVKTILEGVSCSNSICFSPEGKTMFFADTPQRMIRSYAYDCATGKLQNMHIYANLSGEPGLPDGSCVDAEGYVWNAQWEGRRVVRIDPDGEIDCVIDVPALKPSCCAFGGPELDTLYITTSRLGHTASQLNAEPLAGSLYSVKPGVRGMEDCLFAG